MIKRSTWHGASLRLRLALLSTALLGATLLIFGLLVYFTLERAVQQDVDRGLAERATVVSESAEAAVAGRTLLINLPSVDTFSGTFVQAVLINSGRADLSDPSAVSRSETLGSQFLPVSTGALRAVARGRAYFETVEVAGNTLRLYSQPLVVENRVVGILQVARPLEPALATLGQLKAVLIAGGVISMTVCALLGLLVARAALRPIDRLTREAERIGQTQDFSVRVPPETSGRTDEVGRLAATFNAMLDQLQQGYAALQQANKRLQAALESQRRFVADASHELRTPLTTVRGNAALLRRFERLTPEDRRGAVEQIVGESERMSRLVNDLLTLARADAGQLLERKPVAIGPLIEDVALQGRILAGDKVAFNLVRVVDAEVLGDADALRQLLLILVDNAIKYTPGGGSVSLGAGIESQGNTGAQRVVRINVVDTGIGISAADLPHVFERFYRADRARHTGGTGLGLAIGKWIAEAHGGTISAQSAPGAGSIFTVTLPAHSVSPLPSPSASLSVASRS